MFLEHGKQERLFDLKALGILPICKLEEYLRPLNQTVVLVSHVPETFENYERVIWIDEGGVQADGTPRGVIKKYQDAMYKYREKNI